MGITADLGEDLIKIAHEECDKLDVDLYETTLLGWCIEHDNHTLAGWCSLCHDPLSNEAMRTKIVRWLEEED